jgi:hypothetical protein
MRNLRRGFSCFPVKVIIQRIAQWESLQFVITFDSRPEHKRKLTTEGHEGSHIQYSYMKKLTLTLLLLTASLSFYGQKELSGLWMGTLGNDSTTVRKDQNIEFLLAEYKGKVTGYTRTTFMVDDNLYYIVKRVKGVIDGDICEIKDDDIISHNFPQRPEKKVTVVSTFYRNAADSNWYLSGDWKTNKTKRYYAISGNMDLKEEKDLAKSKLFPHLQELKLEKNLPFYQ